MHLGLQAVHDCGNHLPSTNTTAQSRMPTDIKAYQNQQGEEEAFKAAQEQATATAKRAAQEELMKAGISERCKEGGGGGGGSHSSSHSRGGGGSSQSD